MNLITLIKRCGGKGVWAVLGVAFPGLLSAATITVTTTSDSGAGSLRDAITTANGTVNVADTINFNIAGTGPHTITPLTDLPALTDRVVIDGYSQSGSSSNTVTAGDNAVIKVAVLGILIIDTTNSIIRGLAIQQIKIGAAPGLKGSNVVEGCFVGVDTTGTNSLASMGSGVFIQTPNNRVGGVNPGARNIISGKGATGLEVFESFATNNVVQGNFIGTDRTGTRAIPNTDRAIVINMNASRTTVGGTVAGAGNLISGNLDRGITMDGSSNVVQGNFIGTDVTGALPLGNARTGVEAGGQGNQIGGTNAGAGNIIAFNGTAGGDGSVTTNGVDLKAGSTGSTVLGNSIFDNLGLGIDVNADKLVTAGYPVLTLVTNTGGVTQIRGTFTPSVTFRLELFVNPTADPSGFGEGKTLLISTNIVTDAGGVFGVNWPVPLSPGLFVTATANGITEFSQARIVPVPTGPNSWTTNTSGKWEVGANWSLAVAPSASQSVISITNAGTKTVTNDAVTASGFPGSLTISNLVIGAPAGATNTLLLAHGGVSTPLRILKELSVNSGGAMVISNSAVKLDGPSGNPSHINGAVTIADGSFLTTNSSQLYIGSTNAGSLTVSGGVFQAYYPIIGINPGGNGLWHIAGGTNIVTTVLDLGDSLTATGTVRMAGGQLSTPAIYVGLFGNGTLIVSNGTFACAGQGLFGSQPGSVGNFTAAGGSSTFDSIVLGENSSATGAVLVTGTALVRVNGVLEERNNATITVTGGALIATNDNTSLTRMVISNGTYLARDIFLGNGGGKVGNFSMAGASGIFALPGSFNGFNVGANGGTGIVSQVGGQILLTNTDLNIGGLFSPATGQMTISNGLTVARNAYVGGQGGGNGTLRLEGGTLIATNLEVNVTSQFIFNRGTLQTRTASTLVTNSPFVVGDGANPATYQLLGGANVFPKGLRIASNAVLTGIGTINGNVTNLAGSTLSPGASIGTLTISSNLTLAGTTYMELNKQGGTNDRVQGMTSVNYGGTLAVTNIAGTLIPGDAFTLFSATARFGNFSNIVNQTGNSGIAFTFNPTNGVLSVITGLANNRTNLTLIRTGGTLALSWPATHLGWILQSQTNSLNAGLQVNSNAWFDWPASSGVTSTNIPIVQSNPSVFFRLRHP